MEMEEVFCYADDVDEEAQSVHQPPNKEIELQEISESNIVGKKLEEDEVPTRKNTMSENVKGCVHEHCDFFKYKDQSSNWGVLGTLVSFGLIIYMMYAYYIEWKRDAVTYNKKMRVRTDMMRQSFPVTWVPYFIGTVINSTTKGIFVGTTSSGQYFAVTQIIAFIHESLLNKLRRSRAACMEVVSTLRRRMRRKAA